jgi:hypothetical protein
VAKNDSLSKELRKRMLVGEIFGISYIFIVGAMALLHLSSEHVRAQQIAAYLFISGMIISFLYSAVATLHYSLKLSMKKSVYYTIVLVVVGLLLASVGGSIIANK